MRAFILALTCFACSPTPAAVPAPASAPPPASSASSEEVAPAEPETKPAEPEPIVGIDVCDRYLVAYQKCEPKLMPEIQAGNRRTYEAEKNWLVFMKGRPEAKELAQSCASMQAELDKSCN